MIGPDGHIALACKQSHYDKLPEYASWIEQELDTKRHLCLNRKFVRKLLDSYFGGLSDEFSGGLHPSKFVNGLALLLPLGVMLCENTKVNSIKKLGSVHEVITSKGAIKANRVWLQLMIYRQVGSKVKP